MKSISKILSIGVIISFFALMNFFSTEADTPNVPKVKVATDATWPPFEFVNYDKLALDGFDIDLMKAIAQKAGFEIEFINVAFDPLLLGIEQCQFDAAISSIVATRHRKVSMNFSDSYFAAGQIVTVHVNNTDITGKDKLGEKTVGAQAKTFGAIETKKIDKAVLQDYDDIGLAFQDLMNGQIDAVIADYPVALVYVGQNPNKLKTVGPIFRDEYYAIAVSKKKPDLLKKINQGLKAVKAEGQLEKLVKKWFNVNK